MSSILSAAALSFGVVFVAELGDRSQLLAMTYALRYRWWTVLAGITISSIAVHGVSVAIGHSLGATLPERPIAVCAGLAFLGFAVWTWRESLSSTDEKPATARTTRFAFLAVVSSFVLAELGDKTMLATVALASDRPWGGVWLGATTGMVCADAVAIVVGRVLHRSLPSHLLQGLAAALLAVCGCWMILDTALGLRWMAVAVCIVVTLVTVILLTVKRRRLAAGQSGSPADGHSGGDQRFN